MIKRNMQALILAAGKSKRCKTGKTKLLEKICGKELILYPITLLISMRIPTSVIVGHQQESIKALIDQEYSDQISFATQSIQRGTAHAVQASSPLWNKEHILILNGDIPLLKRTIIEELYKKHIRENASISFVKAHYDQPSQYYGRVIEKRNKVSVIEGAEFEENPVNHCCVSPGIYLIKKDFLEKHLNVIEPSPISQEFYISRLINIASDLNEKVISINASFDDVRGVNTMRELWTVEHIKRSELINHWMDQGVRFSTAQNIVIDVNVAIGMGTVIGAGVHLQGHTTIGSNCTIEAYSIIKNATIDSKVHIAPYSCIENAHIQSQCHIGPFAHVYAQTTLGKQTDIGNFVEIKRSTVGEQTNIKHLSYLGDATIGNQVNIGAGTITCNYDGIRKNPTIINDHAFIGTHNALVAPITIGQHAFTAAGSVITQDVPDYALAIARSRQINKEEYTHKRVEKLEQKGTIKPFIAAQKTEHDPQEA
jgi:bifunctional UDP-N-acetylglucosamine pyrophosphorylase / glucosamine-1-phosphate N-acetyltransferase